MNITQSMFVSAKRTHKSNKAIFCDISSHFNFVSLSLFYRPVDGQQWRVIRFCHFQNITLSHTNVIKCCYALHDRPFELYKCRKLYKMDETVDDWYKIAYCVFGMMFGKLLCTRSIECVIWFNSSISFVFFALLTIQKHFNLMT